jgi:hypothetical protein
MLMDIVFDKDEITIELSSFEKILSFHGSFKIMVSQITEVSDILLPPTWKEIRAPGTAFPGVKAGTYYTNRGKEFWMFKIKDNPIRIELNNNKFKRLILGFRDRQRWQLVINSLREKTSGAR